MKNDEARLTYEQEMAVKMLVAGCTVRYTALALGVKERIIHSWMNRDLVFKAELASKEQGSLVVAADKPES